MIAKSSQDYKKKNITLRDSSIVVPFKLKIQPANDNKIFVGSRETGQYLLLHKKWNVALHLLNTQHLPLNELAKILHEKLPQSFSKERAVNDLKLICLFLINSNLIKSIDECKVGRSVLNRPFYLKPKYKKIILLLGLSILTLALFSIGTLPHFFPIAQDFFWSKYMGVNFLSSFIFVWISALLHECIHIFMGKIFGIEGKWRVSHRLHFLVLETYFPDIYSIKKMQRILLYIVPTFVDLAVIAFLVFLLLHFDWPILKQFILLSWLAISWQFFLYLKTDIYFVIRELFGVDNLHTYASIKVRNLIKRPTIELPISPNVDKKITLYAIIMVIGTFIGLLRYSLYTIPIMLLLMWNSGLQLYSGLVSKNIVLVTDGGLILIYQLFVNLVLLAVVIKSTLHKSKFFSF